MLIRLRPFVMLLFLLIFVAAIITAKIQIWMIIFFGSFLLAFLFGRFYCGFICPINTLMELVDRLFKKFGIKRRSNYGWLKNPVFRYGLLVIFILFLAMVTITGKKIPLLPIVTLLGVLLSLFYTPSLWHRYLCPFGTALNLPGSFSRYHLLIDYKKCNSCGRCKKICPGEAVKMENKDDYPVVDGDLCLECLACVKDCPKEALLYGSRNKGVIKKVSVEKQ